MKFSPKVEEILKRLEHVCARELPDGSYELYHEVTGEVLDTVSKEDADKAMRRLNFRKSQKERKKKAAW